MHRSSLDVLHRRRGRGYARAVVTLAGTVIVLLGSLVTPAAAMASRAETVSGGQTMSWSLAGDFRVAPNQANPAPDQYGNANVWAYIESAGNAHNPATYSLLPNFEVNNFGVVGLQDWFGSNCDAIIPDDCLPHVGINATGTTQVPFDIVWPAGSVLMHPSTSNMAVVRWRSPVTRRVEMTGSFDLAQVPGCGNGIRWTVDLNRRTLVAGHLTRSGRTESFALSRFVRTGDRFYLTINAFHQNDGCDSTVTSWTINTA